ncbi:MAG: PAS domain S-box protein [Prolixibacteraceae bacterium]|nr:PAS domain S-box protein [Prolixibacteraceae bacterium]
MDYQDKLREELISELQNQILENDTLKVLYNNEINNRNKIESVLNERLKELNCHNRLSEVLSNPHLLTDEVCKKTLAILPPSMQFPEIAEASIRIPDQVFSTPGYKPSKYSMIQDIKVNQTIVGQIEVCYPVDQVPDVDQLFPPEESSLLFSIAVKLGNYLEKKDKELALKVSSEKYTDLLENINDVIYVTDNHANITFISPSITKLLGYTPEEVIGQNFIHFVGGSSEHLQNRFQEIQKKFKLQNEYLITSRTGEPHWIRFSSQAIIKEGQFIGVTGTLIDITETKRVEIELQKSESLYRSILTASPDTIIIADLEGNVLFTSPMALKMFGFEDAGFPLNQSLFDFLDPKDHNKAKEAIGQMFAGIFGGATEYLGIKADGSTFEIEVNGEFIRDAEGNPTSMVFVVRDISDRKLAKEKAEESEQKFQAIIQSQAEGIGFVNKDEIFEFVNLAAGTIFEIDSDKLIGVSLFDFLAPGEKEKVMLQTGNRKSGNSNNYDLEIVTRAGNTKFLQVSTTPKFDKNGNYLGAYGVFTDNTKRKLAEEKLQKSEEQYRKLVESVNDVIYEIDAIGKIKFVSHSVINILGYTVDEVIGRNIFEYILPEDVPAIMNSLKSLASRDYSFMEYRYVRKDGTIRWVRSSTTANIKDGVMIGATGTLTDVTDRRTAEEKLRKSEETYRHLVETIGEVIYEIASDGTVKYVSPAIHKITGYTPEELNGTNFFRIVYADDMPELLKRMSSMDLNSPLPFDLRFVCKDGEIRWVRSLPSKLLENGVVVGRSGVLTDITNQKNAEIELKQSEERLKYLISSQTNYVLWTDLEGRHIYWNEKFAEEYGWMYTEEGLGGAYSLKSICGYHHQRTIETVSRCIANPGEIIKIELDKQAKDGTIHTTLWEFVCLSDENGPSAIQCMGIDISDRKLAEQQIQQSEQKYKALFYDSPLGYLIIKDGKFIDCNKVSETLIGGDRSYIIGKSPDEISPEYQPNGRKSFEYAEELTNKAFETGNVSFEWVHKRIDETEFLARIELSVIEYEGNRVLFISWLDISAQRESEQKLRESEERFRMVFENVFDGISIFEEAPDPQNRTLIDCNEQFAAMAGRSRKELLELGNTYMLTKTLEEDANEARLKGISEHFAYHGSFSWIRPDGKDNSVEYIAKPVTWNGKSYSIGIDRDITEYKQKEDELRKLSQAVEQSPVSIVITDLEGNIEYANPQACETTGYSLDELKGKNPRVLKSGETPQDEYQFLWKSISNGNIWKGIFHNKRKNGELYWESSQITPITDANGKIINYLALKEDITERKKTQEDLFNSESRFREITEQSQNVIWETNTEAVYTFVSQASEVAWGLKAYDLVGKKRFFDIHPEDGRKEFMEACLRQVQKGEQFRNMESLVQGNDGKINWVMTNGMPYFDSEGNVQGYRGSSLNINLQKSAFEKLRQSEERYKSIFRNNHSVMMIIDPETGYIKDVNTSACEYYKLTYDEMCSKDISEINVLSRKEIKVELQKAKEEKRTQFYFKHRLGNGEIRDVEVYSCPLKFGDSTLLYSIVHDITDRRIAEEALLQRERDLNFSQEIAGMGSWQINLATNTSKWSDNMYRIFDLDPDKEKASQDLFFELIHPDDRHLIGEYMEKILRDRKQVTFEMRINLKSGKSIWIQNSMIPGFEGDQLVTLNGTNVDITYKKLTEEALRINETALNQAQEISKMSSWELNLVTEKLTWSKNYYQMMGIPLGTEMKTKFFLERVHPDDRHLVDEYFDLLKQTKKPVSYDIRLQLKENGYKWIQNNIIPILEDDRLVAIKGVNIDVTDKKLDEEKIKQQNDRLAAIINALPDILFVSDQEGTYLEFYNASSQSLLYDEKKLIGSTVRDVFDEKTANLHISMINECLEQKQLITYEYSSSNTGAIQYFEARLVPLGNDKVLRFVRDFTDKKQKENELIKLSQAVEQSPASIVITDLHANIIYVNPVFETTSGYSSAEAIGKNTSILKSGKTEQHVYQNLWKTIENGKEWKGEWINRKKNGEFYWEEISISPIHNSAGEVVNYMAIKQDISQRKLAEQEIMELNSRLEIRIQERTCELEETNKNLTTEIAVRRLTEQALAESEKSYRTVVENVNEIIFQTDATGLWVFLNKSWEEVTGFSVKESLGQLFVNYVHPDDRARNWELFEPLIQRKKDYCRHQVRYLTKDGGFRWVEVFARLGMNENDEIIGTYGTLMDITDRKVAEELMMQTQQNYETFFNTIDDFLFIFEENGTIVDVNKTVTNRLGYQTEEIINQSVLIVRPANRHEEALKVMEDILNNQVSYCTIPLLTKSGKQIPVETRLKRGFWNGKPVIFGVSKDISQIKISEEKFSSAFHSNSAVMTITRFDNDQFVDVNNAFINLLGYSREEIVGKSLTSLGIVEEIDEGKKIQSFIEKGIPIKEIEINAYSKSHELFIFLLSAEEIYVGLERCILSIAVNITERKRAQEQLQWNKSLLEMMSNSSPLGFLVVDNRTDEILYFNKRFCQIWGIENIEEQMLNGDFKNNDIIPYCLPVLVDIPAFAESCKPLQDENNRTVLSDEIPFSENRTIHRYTTQIRGLDDQYFGRFYIFEDITEEKQSKLELMNAKNEAEKANLAKSEFLSRMSHELRTPMNSILGFAQLLEMGELNARQSKGVNHIMKSGKHLLDLINEVLDISRIEAGRLSLSLEPVQLSGIIPEMIDIVKPQIIERQIRIEVIKSESNQMFVRSDRQRLKQILLNLLNNAIKYNRESGSIWIKTELRPVNELGIRMVRISITDTGMGISEEDLPKLFNPFERIGAEKSATEGTGLGLSVVKKLIEAMAGKLGVESKIGTGSTFWIELPNSESPLEHVEKLGLLKELEPNLANLSGTILYIEDNASNIELVEQILTNQRSRIKLISNMTGSETVQMAIAYRPDLILLDLNLPDLHGSKVLSLLLAEEQTKNIPVVVISADAMPQQLERLLKGGARDYLTKPLDVQEFLLMIDKYIPHQME